MSESMRGLLAHFERRIDPYGNHGWMPDVAQLDSGKLPLAERIHYRKQLDLEVYRRLGLPVDQVDEDEKSEVSSEFHALFLKDFFRGSISSNQGMIEEIAGPVIQKDRTPLDDAGWVLLDRIRDLDAESRNRLWATVKGRLTGSPLVDLGGGNEMNLPLAVAASCSAYMNVDKYLWGRINDRGRREVLNVGTQSIRKRGGQTISVKELRLSDSVGIDVRTSIVQKELPNAYDPRIHIGNTEAYLFIDDMLTFLSRVPDGRANIVINDLDSTPITHDKTYAAALTKEIARVTKPGGIVFGICSDEILDPLSGMTGFSQLTERDLGMTEPGKPRDSVTRFFWFKN